MTGDTKDTPKQDAYPDFDVAQTKNADAPLRVVKGADLEEFRAMVRAVVALDNRDEKRCWCCNASPGYEHVPGNICGRAETLLARMKAVTDA